MRPPTGFVLVQNGMIDEELFFKIYGGMFVRIGKALQDDISNAQINNTHNCEYFVELKTRFEKRFPKYDMPEPYRPPTPGY